MKYRMLLFSLCTEILMKGFGFSLAFFLFILIIDYMTVPQISIYISVRNLPRKIVIRLIQIEFFVMNEEAAAVPCIRKYENYKR